MSKRMKKSSLADQLASLDNPTPLDIDPENAEDYAGSDSNESEDSQDGDDGRSHYAQVGKSKLRDTEAERPLKAEYKGRKSSRKDIYDALSAASEEVSDEEQSEMEANGFDNVEESGGEGDMAAFERSESSDSAGTGSDSESDADTGSDQSGFSGSDDEGSAEDEEDDSEDERQAADFKKMLAEDQKAMVQEVVKTATADAQKGKAVKQQLALYDSLLDSRIKLQKGLQSTNIKYDSPSSGTGAIDSDIKDTEKSALALIETLFTLRDDLMSQDLSVPTPARKRKYDDGDAVATEELWHDLQAMDECLADWRDHTLIKWSNKIQAASGLDKSKKFKALNQGILAQIEESRSDREKLLRRTQIKRYKSSSKSVVSNEDISASVYDDGDFYQEMLKDLIDSRMLDSSNGNSMKWIATKQPKQKKTNVDTRASKGRKLRYHVHEKIQNFMAPIPADTWHEEQVDELFGSLFGQSLKVDEDAEADSDNEDQQELETVEVGDDFRLFG